MLINDTDNYFINYFIKYFYLVIQTLYITLLKNTNFMLKKKSPAGRKKVDPKEQMVPVTVYAKRKFKGAAYLAAYTAIAKYR